MLESIGIPAEKIEEFISQLPQGDAATVDTSSSDQLMLWQGIQEADDWRVKAKYAAKLVGLNYE